MFYMAINVIFCKKSNDLCGNEGYILIKSNVLCGNDVLFCKRFDVLCGKNILLLLRFKVLCADCSILFKVQCSMWQAMKILGQEFGFYIPVMPVGGKQINSN